MSHQMIRGERAELELHVSMADCPQAWQIALDDARRQGVPETAKPVVTVSTKYRNAYMLRWVYWKPEMVTWQS